MSLTPTSSLVPVLRHEDGNVRTDKRGARNTLNNLKFGVLTETIILTPEVAATETEAMVPAVTEQRETLVEIVRTGKKHTRIRRDLTTNGSTELVDHALLSNIQKRAKDAPVVQPEAPAADAAPIEVMTNVQGTEVVNVVTGEQIATNEV